MFFLLVHHFLVMPHYYRHILQICCRYDLLHSSRLHLKTKPPAILEDGKPEKGKHNVSVNTHIFRVNVGNKHIHRNISCNIAAQICFVYVVLDTVSILTKTYNQQGLTGMTLLRTSLYKYTLSLMQIYIFLLSNQARKKKTFFRSFKMFRSFKINHLFLLNFSIYLFPLFSTNFCILRCKNTHSMPSLQRRAITSTEKQDNIRGSQGKLCNLGQFLPDYWPF